VEALVDAYAASPLRVAQVLYWHAVALVRQPRADRRERQPGDEHMDRCTTLLAATLAWSAAAAADTTEARCDVYPAGSDHGARPQHCTFSQRQGYIRIERADGVSHELSPTGEAPGNFRDQDGRTVYRQRGLGDEGLIFRLPDESVYVYWSTAALAADDNDNPTAPFSTSDYDATTLLRCRRIADAAFATCPAGALRMEGGQASVVVQGPGGDQFTINFMSDGVNATDRAVEAVFDGDTWTVTVDGAEVYEVPRAVIEGG
jgi:hypothetical protein